MGRGLGWQGKDVWTLEEIEQARKMRMRKASEVEYKMLLGRSADAARQKLTRGSTGRVASDVPAPRAIKERMVMAGPVPPAHVLAERERTRYREQTPNELILGDPPPGRREFLESLDVRKRGGVRP